MKKLALAGSALFLFAAAALSSCGNSQSENTSATASTEDAQSGVMNIRYIDLDSVSASYNMVKDFNEINIKTMTSLDNAQRAKSQELQRRAAEIENKMKSHGYISEATYNADLQKFQEQQRQAEIYLNGLQEQAQQEALDQSRAFNDSINNFIAFYMKSHNYDAILLKAAGVYFNPALDITKEITEGLNARYIKPADRK